MPSREVAAVVKAIGPADSDIKKALTNHARLQLQAFQTIYATAVWLTKNKFMNIKPLADRVVIEPVDKDKGGKTKSGIYLPETVDKEKPEQGKIVAVGLGKISDEGKRIPMSVKKGDVVLFTKYGPNEIKVDGKEYLIAREEDILAVLE